MRYLFVASTIYDQAGVAMIRGAMNGISKLDNKAQFAALVPKQHSTSNDPACKAFDYPTELQQAFKWADVLLDSGGLACGGIRKVYVPLAHQLKKPYVWLSVSFPTSTPLKVLNGTRIVARGRRSTANVLSITGKKPVSTPDTGFLIEPIKWSMRGMGYKRAYVTHAARKKPIGPMYDTCGSVKSVQVIFKPSRGNEIYEPGLPIDHVEGPVEALYGVIAGVKEVHTARYHGAVAAIQAGFKKEQIKVFVSSERWKYADLLDLCGQTKDELAEQAMVACEIAVEAALGEKPRWT